MNIDVYLCIEKDRDREREEKERETVREKESEIGEKKPHSLMSPF